MNRHRKRKHNRSHIAAGRSDMMAANGVATVTAERGMTRVVNSSSNSAIHALDVVNQVAVRWAAAAAIGVVFVWSYWPALLELLAAWEREPDYSHGYLVLPIALCMLWARRTQQPAANAGMAWGGLVLICVAALIRIAGSVWFVEFIQAWSIPVWIAGACWFLAGRKMLRWAAPAIAFLGFMIPLPFRAESLLSMPLQSIASRLSCGLLQILGQPAIREGNVIVINDLELAVVEACSGLRIFISIVAVAFAYLVFVKKPWWVKTGIFMSILPVALITNALRITLTGLLYVHVSSEAAHTFSHDLAGWVMIPVAAAMMAGITWYLGRLLFEVETQSTRDVIRSVNSRVAV